MNHKLLQNYFLFIVLIVALALAFFVFRPFINVLILAVVFAVAFQPLHRKISKFFSDNSPNLSAFLTASLIIVVILIPVIGISSQILREAIQLYPYLTVGGGFNNALDFFNGVSDYLRGYFPAIGQLSFDVDIYLKQGLNLLIQNIGSVFSNAAKFFVDGLVFLFAIFYLLRDGDKLSKIIVLVSPLSDNDDRAVLRKLERAVNSVVKGNLVVAVVQGVLCSIGFMLFGVPSPVLWGMTAAIAALIPGFGTSLVLIPAILFLFMTGSASAAVGLLVWGVLAVGLIDNYLGPKLVGKNTNLHPFVVMLSVIGGIIFFGPLGFILGPLTISLLFALIDIFLFISGSPEKAVL